MREREIAETKQAIEDAAETLDRAEEQRLVRAEQEEALRRLKDDAARRTAAVTPRPASAAPPYGTPRRPPVTDLDPEAAAAARTEQAPAVLTRETLVAAMERVRDRTGYEPSAGFPPIHPRTHDEINDYLGRPHGTPITHVDYGEFLTRVYAEADEHGKARLLAASLGYVLVDDEPEEPEWQPDIITVGSVPPGAIVCFAVGGLLYLVMLAVLLLR